MYLKFMFTNFPSDLEIIEAGEFRKSTDTHGRVLIEFLPKDEEEAQVRHLDRDDANAYDVLYVLNDAGSTIETVRPPHQVDV